MLAVVAEIIVGTSVTVVGLPGLSPLPAWEAFSVFGYALFACLVVNDAAKVALIAFTRRRTKQIG